MDNSNSSPIKKCPFVLGSSNSNKQLKLSSLLSGSKEMPQTMTESFDFHKFTKTGNFNISVSSNIKKSEKIRNSYQVSCPRDFYSNSPQKKTEGNESKNSNFINKPNSALKPKIEKQSSKINNKKLEFFSQNLEQNKNCPYDKDLLMKHFWQSGENKSKIKENDENLLGKIGTQRLAYILLDYQQKILKIPQLATYFNKLDIFKIFQNKLDFFKKELSKSDINPDLSTQLTLETIHRKFNIQHEDFDIFKGFFAIIFREHLVDEDILLKFLALIEKYRKSIVCETSVFQKMIESSSNFEENLTNKIYEKIKGNHLLNIYFGNNTESFHKKHIKSIYNSLLREDNGGLSYIKDVHKCLHITDHGFYVFKLCIVQSLKEMGITNEKIFEWEEKYEEFRDDVIGLEPYYEILIKKYNINEIINEFYNKIMKNECLKQLFKGFSPERIKKHCEIMLNFCLKGGNVKYSKCDLTPSHFKLELTFKQYEMMRSVFEEVLRYAKFNEQQICYILVDLDYCKYDLCNEKSLLKKIGGQKNIDYIINSFYLKAFQHPSLSIFFTNTDPRKMIMNQTCWFHRFLDSKNMKAFHFKDLRSFHLGMGIDSNTFEFFVTNLVDCLKELDINDEDIKCELINWIYRTKNDIIDAKFE